MTKTKYFKGYRQSYTGNPIFNIHPDNATETYEFLDEVKGKLLRAKEDEVKGKPTRPKEEGEQFDKMMDEVLSTNEELNEYFHIRGYRPDAILLVSYTKLDLSLNTL